MKKNILFITIFFIIALSVNVSASRFLTTVGDSLLVAPIPDAVTYAVNNLTTYPAYNDILWDNQNVGGSCLNNQTGDCLSRKSMNGIPVVERYRAILTNNSAYAFMMTPINDMIGGVTDEIYSSSLDTVIDEVVDTTSTVFILSTHFTFFTDEGSYIGWFHVDRGSEFNTMMRQKAVDKNMPFIEMTYLSNYDASMSADGAHANAVGAQFIGERISEAVRNPTAYIMTHDSFNIYHECDNPVTIDNFTANFSSDCDYHTPQWLILKNITLGNSFIVQRADKPFGIVLNDRIIDGENYTIKINNTPITTMILHANTYIPLDSMSDTSVSVTLTANESLPDESLSITGAVTQVNNSIVNIMVAMIIVAVIFALGTLLLGKLGIIESSAVMWIMITVLIALALIILVLSLQMLNIV
jgi:hypothetical protein